MKSNNLLLLHGAIGAASQFRAWIPSLEVLPSIEKVHALDFEGHGERAFPERPFTIDHFVENVVSFLDENGLEQVDIFGYSMGGYVALRLCMLHPERVGRVFTLATKFAWSPETAAKEAKMLNPDKILEKIPAFAAALEKRHKGNDWRENLARTAAMMQLLGEHPLLTADTLKLIQHPVRIGIGDRDSMVSLEETIGAYRALPQAQLTVWPDTPHPIEQVSLHRAIQAVEDWLS